ncbi:orotidine 5'-phosphate decarboxylase, partial [Ascosphaera acerosa]
MSSRSSTPFAARASAHTNPLARRLFQLALEKQSTLVLSADVTTCAALLDLADRLGPYITVLKTHIDILDDLLQHPETFDRLRALANRHRFLIFEDRKFVDIGSTVQKQYCGGALRISDWAHIVNCSVLAGEGIVEALEQSANGLRATSASSALGDAGADVGDNARGLLILAEMTSKGSLATGAYTAASVDYARRHSEFVLGFVATRALGQRQADGVEEREGTGSPTEPAREGEDFVVFTTGVNLDASGDALGQQYNTPASAVARGADFIIAGRGIYKAGDPVEAAKRYRQAGWAAYLERVGEHYRSPWSNEFDPPLDDGTVPSERVRKLEVAANEAFDVYRELYYEGGGVSSVYFWDLEDGFAGVVLLKK